jgi:peroxiredoxin Q/BCP
MPALMATPQTPRSKKTAAKPAAKSAATGAASKSKTASASASRSAAAQVPAAAVEVDQLVGKKAPSFRLMSGKGEVISSSSLAGAPYVIYFYPKDNTPGCTREACDFRDAQKDFAKLGVRVFGVSPDSTASHQKFATSYGLNFELLSDPDHELAEKYGVWALKKNYGREYYGIVRSTFIVDDKGKVRAAYRGVRVDGHVQKILEELKSK